MALELNGTTGVSLVQDGVITDANLPAGSVLQVVQGIKTSSFSTTATSATNVTGLNATITPSRTSNKILLLAVICGNNISTGFYTQYTRNGTVLTVSDVSVGAASGVTYEAGGSTQEVQTYILLDSPSSTSALTYQAQVYGAGAGTTYINISSNGAGSGGGVSSITLMEIAA